MSIGERQIRLLREYKNTKKQGDAGLGVAIAWFTTQGFGVSIPLTDSQDYDLVIDDGTLKRVQVKTTTFKTEYGVYFVSLTVKGGNRTSAGLIKKFDKAKVDLLFVVTKDGESYLIPSGDVDTQTLNLGEKYEKFRLVV
jgi:hypothetical protein